MLRAIGLGVLRVVTVLLMLVAVAALALFVVTNTNWGRERVRGYAVNFLQGKVNGRVTIGSLSGNLLSSVTAHDFAIRDSAGAPFMVADVVTASYSLPSLLSKRLWFDDVTITRPLVLLDHPPAGQWNYKTIFKHDTTTSQGPASTWTEHIQFTDVTVIDGHLIVRTPWSPSERLTPSARDSAVNATLSGDSRLMVVRVPRGFQKIVELQHVNAKAPLVRLTDPRQPYRLAQVSSLQMKAFPFRPPAAEVKDMRGAFTFNDDSVWWSNVYAEMPASRISGNGRYTLANGDMTLVLRGAPAALADLRWVYPRLPSNGEGTLDFRMEWIGATDTYIARNADVHVGGARVSGNFGFTKSDTVTIHDTDLRLANVDTRLLEQLIPKFSSPRRGTLSGRMKAAGGQHAMQLDGDIAFADVRAGTSRVKVDGVVGFGNGMRMRDLRLELEPVQVELARAYLKSAPISGTLTGNVLLNGDSRTAIVGSGTVRHSDRGAVSEVTGRATIRGAGGRGGSTWFDVDATARPLSLVEVGRFAPAMGLRGYVSGPVRATGTMNQLALRADLRLPDGGALEAHGTVALGGAQKRYDLATAMRVVNLNTVLAKAPRTSLTLRASARGAGTGLATMQGTIAADLATSSWDSVGVDSGTVRVRLANGLATIDRLHVSGAKTEISATGTFGLVAGREGELSYHADIASLGAYSRVLPQSVADTGVVVPRPARILSAVQRARADSARIDRATEVERAIRGGAPPKLVVDTPKAVPRNQLAGHVRLAGVARGNIKHFEVRGRAAGDTVVAFGSTVRHFQSEYAWTNALTPQSHVAVGFNADSLTVAGFSFDSLDLRVGYQKPNGRVEMLVRQGNDRDYSLRADFLLNKDDRELRIADLTLRFDTTRWVATQPSTIRWYANGITVDHFELRDGNIGRIYVNGLLPTQGVANLEVAVDNFQVRHVLDLLQSDIELNGMVSLAGRLEGTMRDPIFRGAYGLVAASYRGAAVPDAHGTFAYANQQLNTHLDLLRTGAGGAPVATMTGTLPINLALTGVTGSRLLDRPLSANVTADSLPLELIPYFTDAVSQVNGLAVGKFAVRGTLQHPSIVGGLAVANGSATITVSGMRMTNIAASVRMLNDSVYVDSIVGQARGNIHLRGAISVASLQNPVFDLYLVAKDAEVLKNEHGRLRADIGLALAGPLRRATLNGQVTITQGVVYVPEPTGKRVINAGDPQLFSVVDTTLDAERNLFPTGSSLFQTTRVDVALVVNHNTWVRSKEMNIEVFTEGPVQVRSFRGNPSLVGTITTDRGEYQFLSKRFQISRGSATFIGGRDLNPTLQVTGEYTVQLAAAPAITVRVLMGGTLKRPKLSLESDAQPPRSQSELLSLLAFGRSTSDLLQGEGNSFVGGVTPGDLVGIGAQVAVRRLAATALGVAVQEFEAEAGRGIGADVFDITPSDVPTQLEGGNSIGTFLRDTKVEVGKYVNPRTFLGLQEHAAYVGVRVQHRDSRGFLYQSYWEPRVLLQTPTLSGQPYSTTTVFGMALIREWRF